MDDGSPAAGLKALQELGAHQAGGHHQWGSPGFRASALEFFMDFL